jgi:transposase
VSRLDHEKDPVVLHQAIKLLENHNRALTEKLKELIAELAKAKGTSIYQQGRLAALERHLAKLTKQVFGPTSEQRTTDTTPDGAGAEDEGTSEDQGEKKKKKKKKGHGPTEQPKLPVVEVEHALDDADQTCPSCGGGLHEMDGQYEEHDEIDVVPLRFVIKRHKRKKYACRCGSCIETALGPDKLTPGGRYSVSFAIYVAISKYCDHLPLERQVRMMAREGLVVTSQTLWDQIEQLTWIVESAMPRLHSYILGHGVVGADETTWELFGKKPGQGKSWYVWVLRVETAVFYAIREGRSFKTAEPLLKGFTGTLMCDGYSVYLALSKAYPRVILAHCWAHVRREFVEIEASFPKPCGEVLDLIRALYLLERPPPKETADEEVPSIERRPPTEQESEAARAERRDTKSRLVIDAIVAWFYRTLPTCLPESGLHKAIGYMVHMWPGLVLFLDDPKIPLDNNGTERAARGPVVGRKNHYGSHSLRGTEVGATLYSLVESAKLNELEPRFYLRVAARAGLRHETVPLPHEVKAMLAEGTLDPTEYDDAIEGIVAAALATADAAARAGPPTGALEDRRPDDAVAPAMV